MNEVLPSIKAQEYSASNFDCRNLNGRDAAGWMSGVIWQL